MEDSVTDGVATSILVLAEYVEEVASVSPPLQCDWYTSNMGDGDTRSLALDRVEEALAAARETGVISYPNMRDWTNVHWDPHYGLLPVEAPRLSQVTGPGLAKLVTILEIIRSLVRGGKRATKRDIFYQMFVEFSSQAEVDRLVAVAVAALQVPRLVLGVVASSKGLVVGQLSFTNTEGVRVDCSLAAGGHTVPQDVTTITDLVTTASLVLVVEKDAVFQRLLEEGVLTCGLLPPLVMITGKGVPDLATRQLVHMLHSHARLPVLILTDCDPYGLEICLVYKYGALASAWAAEPLAVASSAWLGLLPSDLPRLDLGPESMKPHSEQDGRKMLDLSRRGYLAPDTGHQGLRRELELMWGAGSKAEIQQIAEDREEGFLTCQFLPWKIAQADWIL